MVDSGGTAKSLFFQDIVHLIAHQKFCTITGGDEDPQDPSPRALRCQLADASLMPGHFGDSDDTIIITVLDPNAWVDYAWSHCGLV